MLTGRCHCGAVTYEMPAQTIHHALCHCTDCRRAAGAPMVAWAMVSADQMKIDGAPRIYASSEHGRRHFCQVCGTGLFYTNEAVFPGLIDVQTATLDDPGALQPAAHIQVAERIGWMATAHELPRSSGIRADGSAQVRDPSSADLQQVRFRGGRRIAR